MDTVLLKIPAEYDCEPWIQTSEVGLIEKCLTHLQQTLPHAELDENAFALDDQVLESTIVGLEDDELTLAGHQLLHFMLKESGYRVSSINPAPDSDGDIRIVAYTFVKD